MAYRAIFEILCTGEFGGYVNLEWPKTTAARFRAYREQNKGIPQTERWYRTLLKDDATPEQWLEAAQSIVRRNTAGTDSGELPYVLHLPPPKEIRPYAWRRIAREIGSLGN